MDRQEARTETARPLDKRLLRGLRSFDAGEEKAPEMTTRGSGWQPDQIVSDIAHATLARDRLPADEAALTPRHAGQQALRPSLDPRCRRADGPRRDQRPRKRLAEAAHSASVRSEKTQNRTAAKWTNAPERERGGVGLRRSLSGEEEEGRLALRRRLVVQLAASLAGTGRGGRTKQ